MTAKSALKALARAQSRLDRARQEYDAALVEAAEVLPCAESIEATGLAPATYFRRLRAARERLAVEGESTGSRILTGANSDPRYQGPDL